jgi:predicted DNA-binding transcriptional regulator YafY
MTSLLTMLMEAPIDISTATKFVDSGKKRSIYYDKHWLKIEPVRVQNVNGTDFLIAFEEGEDDLKRYELGKITNWNILGSEPAKRAEKEKQTSSAKVVKTELSGMDKQIADAIVNKRIIKLYYQGDKEEDPGWRTSVKPVCFGSRKGVKYVRAWQDSGKTITKVPAWKLFRLDRIGEWQVAGTKTFYTPPRADFNPSGDKHLDIIYAIADFNQDTPPVPPASKPPKPSKPGGTKKAEKEPSISSPGLGGGSTKQEPQSSKKPVKGPARPGALNPARTGKGPARPGAKKDELKESMVGAILEAVRIL